MICYIYDDVAYGSWQLYIATRVLSSVAKYIMQWSQISPLPEGQACHRRPIPTVSPNADVRTTDIKNELPSPQA